MFFLLTRVRADGVVLHQQMADSRLGVFSSVILMLSLELPRLL